MKKIIFGALMFLAFAVYAVPGNPPISVMTGKIYETIIDENGEGFNYFVRFSKEGDTLRVNSFTNYLNPKKVFKVGDNVYLTQMGCDAVLSTRGLVSEELARLCREEGVGENSEIVNIVTGMLFTKILSYSSSGEPEYWVKISTGGASTKVVSVKDYAEEQDIEVGDIVWMTSINGYAVISSRKLDKKELERLREERVINSK